ncbi:uncharacterized protein MKZ38_007673 [Zalerion maritima]|uniref:C2H2-type domain-containing protein n=1 Tax=Zalerion maritima TaxID=339359 RepID=A0AAD5WYP6_9PEZI|nr:uncharacterized protein MKZ38_007673 [Zalerion maritima]
MNIPTSNRSRRHDLRSIYVDGSMPSQPEFRQRGQPITLPSISSAMVIPGTQDQDDVPPPLPPPRYVFDNPMDVGRRPPPSNYGSIDEEKPNYQSRPEKDEGYHSLSSFGSNRSAPKFGMTHDHYYQLNHDYDSTLKKKLDARRGIDNISPPGRRSGLSASISDLSNNRGPPSKFVPLSLPMHPAPRPTILEQTPTSAASPRSAPYYPMDYRSPSNIGDSGSPYKSRRTNSRSVTDDVASTQGSVADDSDFPNEETSGMKRLKLEDSFGRSSGVKRRASSPPGEEPPIHNMAPEIFRRRDPPSRGSPTPRLSIISSVSRGPTYCSNLSVAPTTMAPFSRLSPVGLSPGGISPIGSDAGTGSPYASPMSMNGAAQRAPILRNPHQRNISESRPMASPRKINDGKTGVARLQGFFMCDCCPKKPKKFETEDELRSHEAEKQYECSFCGNRFKNKNEAERHQNSLHVRRHSWSCSALSHYDRAFHDSTAHPGEADVCGYCGEEFTRNGGQGRMRQATDQDWDDRIRHLQEVHKFRECNSAKKFYRADHFRQHLKHSHAGTSGKWTNMLENACMMEEDPSPR